MSYTCGGCGRTDHKSPPDDVMPRMVLSYRSEILCESCKISLEEHLLLRWAKWMIDREALVSLNAARNRGR